MVLEGWQPTLQLSVSWVDDVKNIHPSKSHKNSCPAGGLLVGFFISSGDLVPSKVFLSNPCKLDAREQQRLRNLFPDRKNISNPIIASVTCLADIPE